MSLRALGRPRAASLLIAAVVCALATGTAAADELSGYLELVARKFSQESQVTDGETVATETNALFKRFNLYFDRSFYPQLRLRAGGFFEVLDSELAQGDQTTTSIRPYLNLTMRTPVNWAEFGYNLNQVKRDVPRAEVVTDVRETWTASLAWFPDTSTKLRFLYTRTNLFDKARIFQDRTEDRLLLTGDAAPIRPLMLTYRGSLRELTDHLGRSENSIWSHVGKIRYSDGYWDERVRLSTDYRLTYTSTETSGAIDGVVRTPLFPFAGLSAVDEDMSPITLVSNPALIDSNRATPEGAEPGIPPVGIDLGVPLGSDDDTPRQLGLDLASAQELNTLLVWVDRELPAETSRQFTWTVYTSEDNDLWTLHATVGACGPAAPPLTLCARFGTLLNRFDIRFPRVARRYVKVVTTPVSPSDPFVTDPSILVTELEAELVLDAADAQFSTSSAAHLFNIGIQTRILDIPNLFYEFTYFLNKVDSRPGTYRMTNGLSLHHRFNRVYSIASRVALRNDQVSSSREDSLIYSVSLNATAIPTLQHRVVFSGRHDESESDERDVMSVFLFNSMKIYKGIDLTLTLGKSSSETGRGDRTDTDEVNLGTTFIPHRTFNLNILVRDRNEESRLGRLPGTIQRFNRAWVSRVAYNPLSTLYLFVSYRLEERTDVPRRSFWNHSIDWTPFRGGQLQFSVRYFETVRSEDDSETSTLTPRLRWNFGRNSFFDIAYEKTTNKSPLRRRDDETFFGNLRFSF